jgi:hypothetical protein
MHDIGQVTLHDIMSRKTIRHGLTKEVQNDW